MEKAVDILEKRRNELEANLKEAIADADDHKLQINSCSSTAIACQSEIDEINAAIAKIQAPAPKK